MVTNRESRIEKKRKRLAKLPPNHFLARQIKRYLKKWGADIEAVEEVTTPVVVAPKPKPKKKKGLFGKKK